MPTLVNSIERQPISVSLNAAFVSRLGGAAGLLMVALAVAAGVLSAPALANEKLLLILSSVSMLVGVVWLIGISASQSPRLGRLGLLGLCAAAAGLAGIVALNTVDQAANANPAGWAGRLMASPAMPPLFIAVAVSFVWGALALGTASLRAGVLPRGAVVLWTLGLMASLAANWLPVSLVSIAGVLWSSIVLLRGVHAKALDRPARLEATATGPERFLPLDALRGGIMILMAIDHASYFVRRWHPFETWDQPLPVYPSLAAMLTRLATHPCAPGFYFLMGAGMLLFAHSRRRLGWSERRIAGHLALRGLLFIVLEQLIVDVATAGQIYPLEFSILSGLGVAMLFGIFFLRLSGPVQAAAGLAVILVMQALPGLMLNADLGIFSPVRLLLLPGSVGPAFALYPPIPWLGVALLGMAFARLLLERPDRAYRWAGIAGLACLALFPLVRLAGGFGNLRMPVGHTLIDFFNVVKYPPSLSFLLLSLGIDLAALYVFSRAAAWLTAWGRPLVTLGKAALYFFLVHWFVYRAMGIAGPGGLPETYLAWAAGIILLYPVCRAFESFKHGLPPASAWRLL